jgi:hypothetical protein
MGGCELVVPGCEACHHIMMLMILEWWLFHLYIRNLFLFLFEYPSSQPRRREIRLENSDSDVYDHFRVESACKNQRARISVQDN